MNNPQISIIVPVYNVEKYLKRCIDSILKQTFTNFELILINDGSTDSSGQICDEYARKDKRIKVYHKKNEGASIARNTGIINSNGQFILFVDSDDFIDEEYISSYLKYPIEEYTLLIQGCSIYDINDENRKPYQLEHKKYEKNEFYTAISENELFKHGSPYGKLYAKSIIDKYNIRFDKNLLNFEDLIFFLRYLQHINKLVFTPDIGYHYFKNDNGLHNRFNQVKDELRLMLLYNNFVNLFANHNRTTDTNFRDFILVLYFRFINSTIISNSFFCAKYTLIKKINNRYKHIFEKTKDKYLSKKERIIYILIKNKLITTALIILIIYHQLKMKLNK